MRRRAGPIGPLRGDGPIMTDRSFLRAYGLIARRRALPCQTGGTFAVLCGGGGHAFWRAGRPGRSLAAQCCGSAGSGCRSTDLRLFAAELHGGGSCRSGRGERLLARVCLACHDDGGNDSRAKCQPNQSHATPRLPLLRRRARCTPVGGKCQHRVSEVCRFCGIRVKRCRKRTGSPCGTLANGGRQHPLHHPKRNAPPNRRNTAPGS